MMSLGRGGSDGFPFDGPSGEGFTVPPSQHDCNEHYRQDLLSDYPTAGRAERWNQPGGYFKRVGSAGVTDGFPEYLG
jgi:hypothetical protein